MIFKYKYCFMMWSEIDEVVLIIQTSFVKIYDSFLIFRKDKLFFKMMRKTLFEVNNYDFFSVKHKKRNEKQNS